ncbi:MAG: hypothetical protein QNJ38_11615 [Prochloraceae cyanobacterium]|nr:hypothetical protein [Prochloraceae cyanobacterium]
MKKNKNIQVEIVLQSINLDRRLAAGVLFSATLYQLDKIMLQINFPIFLPVLADVPGAVDSRGLLPLLPVALAHRSVATLKYNFSLQERLNLPNGRDYNLIDQRLILELFLLVIITVFHTVKKGEPENSILLALIVMMRSTMDLN